MSDMRQDHPVPYGERAPTAEVRGPSERCRSSALCRGAVNGGFPTRYQRKDPTLSGPSEGQLWDVPIITFGL